MRYPWSMTLSLCILPSKFYVAFMTDICIAWLYFFFLKDIISYSSGHFLVSKHELGVLKIVNFFLLCQADWFLWFDSMLLSVHELSLTLVIKVIGMVMTYYKIELDCIVLTISTIKFSPVYLADRLLVLLQLYLPRYHNIKKLFICGKLCELKLLKRCSVRENWISIFTIKLLRIVK